MTDPGGPWWHLTWPGTSARSLNTTQKIQIKQGPLSDLAEKNASPGLIRPGANLFWFSLMSASADAEKDRTRGPGPRLKRRLTVTSELLKSFSSTNSCFHMGKELEAQIINTSKEKLLFWICHVLKFWTPYRPVQSTLSKLLALINSISQVLILSCSICRAGGESCFH